MDVGNDVVDHVSAKRVDLFVFVEISGGVEGADQG